jgi:aspartate aminotransferase-like enzyme
MKKQILLTPGPSQIPPRVAEIASRPIIHHRTQPFRDVLARIHRNMQCVMGTSGDVFILASTGTGALEAGVTNTLSPGDKVICAVAGKFGERYSEICQAYGMNVVEIVKEWGGLVTAQDVEQALKSNPDAKAVFVTHSETSTGALHPLHEIGPVVRAHGALFIVDTVSALGGVPMKMDEWGIDMLAAGSQKALMIGPGLAFLGMSERAWKAYESSTLPKFYFDMKHYKKRWDDKGETPFTSAVTLCLQVDEALQMIMEEGVDNVLERHRRLSRACKAGVAAMGLEFYSENRSDIETVIKAPRGVDGVELVNLVQERFGIKLSGGQAHVKGKIVRIAHMGYATEHDVILALSALEMCLARLGFHVALGSGVKAAEEVFQNEM